MRTQTTFPDGEFTRAGNAMLALDFARGDYDREVDDDECALVMSFAMIDPADRRKGRYV